MRIAVIGAGAIGSGIGALLARAGDDVFLVGRPAHVNAIREKGLEVDGYLGGFIANVDGAESLQTKPDIALLAVKTQDVASAVQANAAHLGGVPLVTLQNGIRSDEIVAQTLPRSQIISAVVVMSATYLTPGRVTLIDKGNLIMGRPFGPNDDVVRNIAETLDKGVKTRVTDNIVGAHWTKLMINLNNALPAMTGLPIDEAYGDKRLSRLAVSLIIEGLRVADRLAVKLESIPGVDVNSLRRLGKVPLRIAAGRFAANARRWADLPPNYGSTLQSIKRGRPTEIDYLNGEIVDLGGKLGVQTPLNAKVLEIVHRIERGGRFLSVDEIVEETGVA